MPGGEHDQVVTEGLERAHGLAPRECRVGEQRGEIVSGVSAPIRDDAIEHRIELEADLLARLGAVVAGPLVVGIIAGEQLLRQFEQSLFVVAVDTENRGEYPQRVALRDAVDEVTFAFFAQRVDQSASARRDDLIEFADAARREESAGDLAIDAMIRRVHFDDGAHRAQRIVAACLCGDLLFVEHDDAMRIGEDVGLARDLGDVLVARDGPEALEAVGLAPVHRGVAAHRLP